jgi:hypothetical protein
VSAFFATPEMGHSPRRRSDNVDCLFPDGTHGLERKCRGTSFRLFGPLVTSIQFIVQFAMSEKIGKAELWGNWDDLFGVVLFNFALVIAIPAWLRTRTTRGRTDCH